MVSSELASIQDTSRLIVHIHCRNTRKRSRHWRGTEVPKCNGGKFDGLFLTKFGQCVFVRHDNRPVWSGWIDKWLLSWARSGVWNFCGCFKLVDTGRSFISPSSKPELFSPPWCSVSGSSTCSPSRLRPTMNHCRSPISRNFFTSSNSFFSLGNLSSILISLLTVLTLLLAEPK